MREALQEKLMHEFPFMQARNVWSGEKLDFPIYCECGDGWYGLIMDLCRQVQKVLDKESSKFVEGFYPIQIKEKYGGLRFYTTYGNDEIFKLIDEAEEKSTKICERCGNPGVLRGNSWLYTLCDECEKNR